jgi:hypothetical protein
MTVRYYSSTAIETTLMAPVTGSTTIISVAATTGFPGTTPFTLALDYESATNELVDVTNIAGTNLTVARGVDGTSATSHNAGAKVRHVTSARDETDSRNHENASQQIHGLAAGDTIVGTLATQTLHNKTLDKATGDLKRVDIFNGPSWATTVIGDSTTPNFAKFLVLDNEINLDPIAYVDSKGQLTVNPRTDFTTNDVALAVVTRAASAGDRLLYLGRTTSGDPFKVWDDGRVDINQVGNVGNILDITPSATNTFSLQRWLDNGGTAMASVGFDGRFNLVKGLTVNGAQGTGFIVLNVQGLAGQTANLQEWRNSAATTLGFVDPSGNINMKAATFTGLTVNGNASITGNLTVSGAGQIQTAIKPADTVRTSTTTLTNDPDLVLSVVANAVYELTGTLAYNGISGGVGDFKADWTIPAAAAMTWVRNGYINNSVTQTDTIRTDNTTIRSLGTFGVGTTICASIRGIVRTGANAGSLQLRWAQNTSSATSTTLAADSNIVLRRIS